MIKVPNFVSNRLTWMSAAIILLFCLAATMYEEKSLAEFARTSLVAIAFCALIGYIADAIAAYRAHIWPNRPLLAALGNCLLFGGISIGGLFQMLWRLSNFDNVIVTNDFYTFTIMMMAIGILILIVLPNFIGSGVTPRTRWVFITLWTMAAGSVIILAITSPDLTWFAEYLKPYLRTAPPPHTACLLR